MGEYSAETFGQDIESISTSFINDLGDVILYKNVVVASVFHHQHESK